MTKISAEAHAVVKDIFHACTTKTMWMPNQCRDAIAALVQQAIDAAIKRLHQPSDYLDSCVFAEGGGCEKGMSDCNDCPHYEDVDPVAAEEFLYEGDEP